FLSIRASPRPALFPYTTLFRSRSGARRKARPQRRSTLQDLIRAMPLILLVRHAQASFGTDDYDRLSELGRQQARWLGEYFAARGDRKSTRLNSSHVKISYAVFC